MLGTPESNQSMGVLLTVAECVTPVLIANDARKDSLICRQLSSFLDINLYFSLSRYSPGRIQTE